MSSILLASLSTGACTASETSRSRADNNNTVTDILRKPKKLEAPEGGNWEGDMSYEEATKEAVLTPEQLATWENGDYEEKNYLANELLTPRISYAVYDMLRAGDDVDISYLTDEQEVVKKLFRGTYLAKYNEEDRSEVGEADSVHVCSNPIHYEEPHICYWQGWTDFSVSRDQTYNAIGVIFNIPPSSPGGEYTQESITFFETTLVVDVNSDGVMKLNTF